MPSLRKVLAESLREITQDLKDKSINSIKDLYFIQGAEFVVDKILNDLAIQDKINSYEKNRSNRSFLK